MEQGTFAEFSKFGIDFEDIILWEETEEAEPSPGPGTLTMISESSVQSQRSSRPSLKDAAPEDQDVFLILQHALVCLLLVASWTFSLLLS